MLAGAAYDPGARCPVWDAHLRRCLVSDELVEFYEGLAGPPSVEDVASSDSRSCYGTGANGKTAIRNAIARALGDYAHQSSLDLLMQSGRGVGQATPELADLRGRRFVTVSEAPEDGRLAAERVKAITGSEPITARRLHRKPLRTRAIAARCWLATNSAAAYPRRPGHAILQRRVLLIPLRHRVTIPDDEQDRDFGDKLAAERSRNPSRWIIEGSAVTIPATAGLDPHRGRRSRRTPTRLPRKRRHVLGLRRRPLHRQSPESSEAATPNPPRLQRMGRPKRRPTTISAKRARREARRALGS